MAENLSLVAQLLIDRTKALVAIQELHGSAAGFYCDHCSVPSFGYEAPHDVEYPCPTRRLADDALGGDNNG